MDVLRRLHTLFRCHPNPPFLLCQSLQVRLRRDHVPRQEIGRCQEADDGIQHVITVLDGRPRLLCMRAANFNPATQPFHHSRPVYPMFLLVFPLVLLARNTVGTERRRGVHLNRSPTPHLSRTSGQRNLTHSSQLSYPVQRFKGRVGRSGYQISPDIQRFQRLSPHPLARFVLHNLVDTPLHNPVCFSHEETICIHGNCLACFVWREGNAHSLGPTQRGIKRDQDIGRLSYPLGNGHLPIWKCVAPPCFGDDELATIPASPGNTYFVCLRRAIDADQEYLFVHGVVAGDSRCLDSRSGISGRMTPATRERRGPKVGACRR